MKLFFKDMLAKMTFAKFIWVFLGTFLIGLSVSMCRLSGFGTDPFSCMNLGVSGALRHNGLEFMSYANYQLIVNILLLIPMIIWYRKGLGIGTVVNMVGVGYCAEISIFLWGRLGITIDGMSEHLLFRILFMSGAVLVLTLGVALYMQCDLGIAPYDAVGQIVELNTGGKVKFAPARVAADIICVLIGFSTGSVVGVATVVTAFFTGPFVTFFRNHVAAKVIKD